MKYLWKIWTQKDSGAVNDDGNIREEADENFGYGRTWTDTLAWVEKMNAVNHLGHNDWQLTNIKELQSIVEYEKTELLATVDPAYAFFEKCQVQVSSIGVLILE
ncbi:MAG: DUF1566 domain-containing protein [Desulfamplus sp.]|nr:DUF1566 domain-containing protein [Desulfamplus sp.]